MYALTKASFLRQWIGAPLQLLLGVIAVARWALVPHHIETVNPNWMIPVVGNLVASLAAVTIDADYNEASWLWYGFAVVYWIPLFVMSTLRVTTREPLGMHAVASHSGSKTSDGLSR